jgi:hypothetical protein
VGCNDDAGGGLASQLTATVRRGTTYYLVVAQYAEPRPSASTAVRAGGNLLVDVPAAPLAARTVGGQLLLRVAAPASAVAFDGAPGTAAPPTRLANHVMAPFASDARAARSVVTTIAPGRGAAPLSLSAGATLLRVGTSWQSWSHSYRGDVYYVAGTELVLSLPPRTRAVRFYLQPNDQGTHAFTVVEAASGRSSGLLAISGRGGARSVSFVGSGAQPYLTSIRVSAPAAARGFAIGTLALAVDTRSAFDQFRIPIPAHPQLADQAPPAILLAAAQR